MVTYFTHHNEYLLVTVHLFSRFSIIRYMKSTKRENAIRAIDKFKKFEFQRLKFKNKITEKSLIRTKINIG